LEASLQFAEELANALFTDVLDALPAVTRHEAQLFREGLQHPGNVFAPSTREIAQDPAFVLKAFCGLVAAKGFVDEAIVTDSDEGAAGIFHLLHGQNCSDSAGVHEGGRSEYSDLRQSLTGLTLRSGVFASKRPLVAIFFIAGTCSA
jgi:hypothetical protein